MGHEEDYMRVQEHEDRLQFCFTTVRHVGYSCSPLSLVLLGWVFWFVAFFLDEQLLISF